MGLGGLSQASPSQAGEKRDSNYSDKFNIPTGLPATDEEECYIVFNPILGEWLVVWEDARSGNDTGIYASRVDKVGNLVSSENTLKDNDDILRYPWRFFPRLFEVFLHRSEIGFDPPLSILHAVLGKPGVA